MREEYNRVYKNQVRERLFAALPRPTMMITLPGMDALCVRHLLAAGVIDKGVEQVWVEREPERIPHLDRQAKMLGLAPKIVFGDIREWTPEADFDLLNLDLEEGISDKTGLWLEQIAPRIKDGAALVFTFTQSSRNRKPNHFRRWFADACESNETLRLMRDFCVIDRLNHYNEPLALAVVMVACALRGFFCDVQLIEDYADGFPMIAFRVQVRRHRRTPMIPAFSELAKAFSEGYESAAFQRHDVDTGPTRVYRRSDRIFGDLGTHITILPTTTISDKDMKKPISSAEYTRRARAAATTRRLNKAKTLREQAESINREIEVLRRKQIDLLSEAKQHEKAAAPVPAAALVPAAKSRSR